MTNLDKRWAEEWYFTQYHHWEKHCQWCNLHNVIVQTWRDYLLERIEGDLIKHKTTKCRNGRMRHIITFTWETLEACEIIQRLDLNA